MEIGFDTVDDQAVDKTDACPPEGLRSLRRRNTFNRGQCITHPLQSLLRLDVAQERQQAALEQATRGLDFGCQRFLRHRIVGRLAVCPRTQVGEEQLAFEHALRTLQFAQPFVEREQRQLAAAAPVGQVLDPALQAFDGIAQGAQHVVARL